ncbi:FkbM family methyltransferase [Paenibacillus tarimensis]
MVPRGVIHIGAHEGQEMAAYKAMGIGKVLLIEANPNVYERLRRNVQNISDVQLVQCAISNYNGTVQLHVTSMDQSISILPLKSHQVLYPFIVETDQLNVECKTLDSLLNELSLSTSDFNILNIDIQGAELLAFEGATNTLKHIAAILTEINFAELYEGCALARQLDEFLKLYGFVRVATSTPYHPSWGDAFYVTPFFKNRRCR